MHSVPHRCAICSGMWTSPTLVPSITILTMAGPPGWGVSGTIDSSIVCTPAGSGSGEVTS
jgi:hypothetical protein